MAMDKNYGIFGLAVQADETTAAAAPVVTFPASASSDGIDVSEGTEGQKLTIGGRDTTVARYKSDIDNTAKVTTLGFADLLTYLLYSALGKDEVSGSAGKYVHDIKMGDGLPTMTFTQQVGAKNAALQQLEGGKLASLSFSAEGITPPAFDFQYDGTKAKWLPATAWTGPAFKVEDGWYTTAGAEVLFSLTDGDAAEPPASIILDSLSVEVSNNLTKQTRLGQMDPAKQKEGSTDVTCSLRGTTTDTVLYRQVKTGSETGTEVARGIVTGSLQVTFPHTVNDDWELVVKIGCIPWSIEAMSVDPDGGEFDLNLSTEGAIAVDGTSIEFLLNSKVAHV